MYMPSACPHAHAPLAGRATRAHTPACAPSVARLQEIDTDGSGTIEYDELRAAFSGEPAIKRRASRAMLAPRGMGSGDALIVPPARPAALPRPRPKLDPLRPLLGQLSDIVRAQMRDVLALFREWDADGSGAGARTRGARARQHDRALRQLHTRAPPRAVRCCL